MPVRPHACRSLGPSCGPRVPWVSPWLPGSPSSSPTDTWGLTVPWEVAGTRHILLLALPGPLAWGVATAVRAGLRGAQCLFSTCPDAPPWGHGERVLRLTRGRAGTGTGGWPQHLLCSPELPGVPGKCSRRFQRPWRHWSRDAWRRRRYDEPVSPVTEAVGQCGCSSQDRDTAHRSCWALQARVGTVLLC